MRSRFQRVAKDGNAITSPGRRTGFRSCPVTNRQEQNPVPRNAVGQDSAPVPLNKDRNGILSYGCCQCSLSSGQPNSRPTLFRTAAEENRQSSGDSANPAFTG